MQGLDSKEGLLLGDTRLGTLSERLMPAELQKGTYNTEGNPSTGFQCGLVCLGNAFLSALLNRLI